MLHVIRLLGLALIVWSMSGTASESASEKQYIDLLDEVEAFELSEDLSQRMQAVTETYHSEAFRKNVAKYNNDLKRLTGADEHDLLEQKRPEASDRPILFISSSIPLNVLRKYAEQLDGIGGGTMVLRGFVGGPKFMMPTLEFISSVINVDLSCRGSACNKHGVDVIVDPVLFEHHGIDRVPAFMVYESKTYLERCTGSQAKEPAKTVFGDASIKGLALELASHDRRATVQRFITRAGYDK